MGASNPTAKGLLRIFQTILDERRRQDDTHGFFDYQDGTGRFDQKERAEYAKRFCDLLAHNGTVTWGDLLSEEVAEVMAESDAALLRTELIQVAALAIKWIQAIDQRGQK